MTTVATMQKNDFLHSQQDWSSCTHPHAHSSGFTAVTTMVKAFEPCSTRSSAFTTVATMPLSELWCSRVLCKRNKY